MEKKYMFPFKSSDQLSSCQANRCCCFATAAVNPLAGLVLQLVNVPAFFARLFFAQSVCSMALCSVAVSSAAVCSVTVKETDRQKNIHCSECLLSEFLLSSTEQKG